MSDPGHPRLRERQLPSATALQLIISIFGGALGGPATVFDVFEIFQEKEQERNKHEGRICIDCKGKFYEEERFVPTGEKRWIYDRFIRFEYRGSLPDGGVA